MSVNINLLLRTDKESLKRKKRIKIFNFAAGISLISVGLISLFIFMSIKAANSSPVRNEQESILKKLSQFQDRQAKLFVLNNRAENVEKILKTRRNISNTTNSLLAKIPGQLSVQNFEVDDKSVIITGQSKSLLAINEFIDDLTDMVRKKDIIKSLNLNFLTLDNSEDVYRFSIKSSL